MYSIWMLIASARIWIRAGGDTVDDPHSTILFWEWQNVLNWVNFVSVSTTSTASLAPSPSTSSSHFSFYCYKLNPWTEITGIIGFYHSGSSHSPPSGAVQPSIACSKWTASPNSIPSRAPCILYIFVKWNYWRGALPHGNALPSEE